MLKACVSTTSVMLASVTLVWLCRYVEGQGRSFADVLSQCTPNAD